MRFGNQLNAAEKILYLKFLKLLIYEKHTRHCVMEIFYTLQADENIYAFIRSDFNERILVVINKSDVIQNMSLKIPEMYNCISAFNLSSKDNIKFFENNLNFTIDKQSWAFYKLD